MARSKDRVVVATVHPVEVAAGFHHSVTLLLAHDLTGPRRIANVMMRNASANICNARNSIVREFLDEETAEWLWMVDADMVFDPDTLDRLLDSAHHVSAPVVGALCYGVHEGRLFPTMYAVDYHDRETQTGPYVVRYRTFDETGKFRVDATGAACLLVHRSVLEAIRDKGFNDTYRWFQETSLNGESVGEDITFCFRAGLCGFPVHVDTTIRIGHQKTYVIDHDMYLRQRHEREHSCESQPGSA